MKLLKRIKSIIPENLRITINEIPNYIIPFHYRFFHNKDLSLLVNKINLFFMIFPSRKKEYINEINFLNTKAKKSIPISFIFPYPFVYEYDTNQVNVYRDTEKQLFYVIHKGHKLYYHSDFKTEQSVKENYLSIAIEQDERSPHRYIFKEFDVFENDVVVDIGAAEGNFSLEVVEKARSLYIFETDIRWIEALEATFEPWKEKVHIINKFVSNTDTDHCVTLNTFFGNNPIHFIKMDVEGAEMFILESSKDVLCSNQSLKLAICTYHKQSHEEEISSLLLDSNYRFHSPNGSMLFLLDRLSPPYFRKGLIRAINNVADDSVKRPS